MRALFWSGIVTLALAVVGNHAAGAVPVTLLDGLRYEAARHALVFSITGPVAISSRELQHPHRYVIDIPDAHWRVANGIWRFNDPFFKEARVAQFGIVPPVVRIVLVCTARKDVTLAVQQDQRQLFVTVTSLTASPNESTEHEHASPLVMNGAERESGTDTPAPVAEPQRRPIREPEIETMPGDTRASEQVPPETPR